MGCALLITSGEKASSLLRPLLEAGGFSDVREAASGQAAQAQLALSALEVVVLAAPLAGGELEKLAEDAALKTRAGVILVVGEWPEGSRAEEAGVLLMKRPFSAAAFLMAVRHARAIHRRLLRLAGENEKLHVRLDDMKLIGRAKLLLVKRFSMTEEQAHHYLQQQAMRERVSLGEAARSVVEGSDLAGGSSTGG